MKILVIGDPHGKLGKIKRLNLKKIDLILITGDLGKADLARKRFFENVKRERDGLPEIEDTPEFARRAHMEIYNSSIKIIKYLAKFAPVYTILGNVGTYDSEVKKESKRIGMKLPLFADSLKKVKNFKLISNRFVNFSGVRIGGLEYFHDACWSKEFHLGDKKWLSEARKETAKAKRILKWFGKNKIDVLLCHQPPYGVLDKISGKYGAPKRWWGKYAGSKVILDYIKKKQPRYVFCGHIHEGKGMKKIGKTKVYNVGCEGDYVLVDVE